MNDLHFHRLRIAEVVAETHDAHSIVFDLAPNQKRAFAYTPGQFLTLRIPSERGPVARCYSLASSPHTDDKPKVTVKRTADGYGSNWLCDHARAGATIDVLEPAGVFTPRHFDGNFLLVAGGSGITPVMSILKSVLSDGTGSIVLFYANRDQESVIFKGELRSLVAAYPERLTVIHWLESVQGIPSQESLTTLFRILPVDHTFVCGPKPFMDATRKSLKDIDFPRSNLHIERFSSLGGDPFADAVAAPDPDHVVTRLTRLPDEVDADDEQAVSDSAREIAIESTTKGDPDAGTDTADSGSESADRIADATVLVDLGGQTHTFEWPADVRLLDLLKSKGLPAPSSCSEGVCAACECRLVEGQVTMVNNQVLEEEDIADGYILACQSLPVTDVVKVTYEQD